jgi:hypothetical protein
MERKKLKVKSKKEMNSFSLFTFHFSRVCPVSI